MANPAEQPSDGQDGSPPTTPAVARSNDNMTPPGQSRPAVPLPRTPDAGGDAARDRMRPPPPAPPSRTPADTPMGTPPAAGPGPLRNAVRPRRSFILLAGTTAAVLVVGLAWWSHDRSSAVASQELPPAAGVATMRITVPGTDDETTNSGAGGEAPTTKPTKRTTTTTPPRASVSPTPPKAQANINTSDKNLALNRTAWASSSEGAAWGPENAIDGNAETRWSSAFSDPQWLAVDLGARWQINEVRLSWENAYAKAYRLEVSTDGKAWKSVYSTENSPGGNVSLEVSKVTAQFVRVYCIRRSGDYGYSLFEVDVR